MGRFTAFQSRLLGAVVERLVRLTGGSCRLVEDLRVCRVGWFRLYGRGGTQWGDTFVCARAFEALTPGLLRHERHHRDAQWRRYGLVFGVMYLWAELWDVRRGKLFCNRYELAAEEASDWGGGYGPPRQPPP